MSPSTHTHSPTALPSALGTQPPLRGLPPPRGHRRTPGSGDERGISVTEAGPPPGTQVTTAPPRRPTEQLPTASAQPSAHPGAGSAPMGVPHPGDPPLPQKSQVGLNLNDILILQPRGRTEKRGRPVPRHKFIKTKLRRKPHLPAPGPMLSNGPSLQAQLSHCPLSPPPAA